MDSLNDLLRALILVIVRYHQAQNPLAARAMYDSSIASISDPKDEETPPALESNWEEILVDESKSQASPKEEASKRDDTLSEKTTLDKMLLKLPDEFNADLATMIRESTQQVNTRRSLLCYLHHVILVLREHQPLIGTTIPTQLQPTLVNLLSNLQTLYYMSPFQSLPVTLSGETMSIPGLSGGFTQKKSKIAPSIDHLIMRPLGITKTTDLSTLHLQVQCLILKEQVTVLTKPEPMCGAATDERLLHMAEQLALQAKEIERLKGLLLKQPLPVTSGSFRLFNGAMNFGVVRATSVKKESTDDLSKTATS